MNIKQLIILMIVIGSLFILAFPMIEDDGILPEWLDATYVWLIAFLVFMVFLFLLFG